MPAVTAQLNTVRLRCCREVSRIFRFAELRPKFSPASAFFSRSDQRRLVVESRVIATPQLERCQMQDCRRLLKMSAGLSSSLAAGMGTAAPHGCSAPSAGGIEVNDMRSQLNATCVNDLRQPETVCDLQKALRDARRQRRSISVSGG